MTQKGKNWVLVVVVGFFIVGIRAFSSKPISPTGYFVTSKTSVIAHQGGDGLRPGNTMTAFQHAVNLGVDVLEMDVHRSSDGHLVTIHDDTLKRTTNGEGLVRETPLTALKALDAGYHWVDAQGKTSFRGNGAQIATLAEVFEQFPDMRFNLEIKQEEPSITSELCALLRKFQVADQTLVASFHRSQMLLFRQECSEVATSAYSLEVTWFFIYQKLSLMGLYHPNAHALQLPMQYRGYEIIDREMVADAARRGMLVDVWTPNERQEIEHFLDLGVSGLISDYPDRVLTALGRR